MRSSDPEDEDDDGEDAGRRLSSVGKAGSRHRAAEMDRWRHSQAETAAVRR